MEAAAQKKSNSRRRAGIQDYERHLANSHSPHRRRWFDFHLGPLYRRRVSPSYGLAPYSDGCVCVKQIYFLAPRSYRADD